MRIATLSLLFVLAACGKDPEDTTLPHRDTEIDEDTEVEDTDTEVEDTDTDRPPAPDCSGTPIDECDDRIECRLIKGYKVVAVDTGGYCVAFALSPGGADLGCRHVEDTCSGTAAWGRIKTKPGTCNYFDTGCVPDGWVACDDAAQETVTGCTDGPPE